MNTDPENDDHLLDGNPSDTDFDHELNSALFGRKDEMHPLISAYLAIKPSKETVRVAARMAPRTRSFDPATLIDRALALQTELEAGVTRFRDSILSRMDHFTLIGLLLHLGAVDLSIPISPVDSRLADPIIGPALRKYIATRSIGPILSKEGVKLKTSNSLQSADNRTGLSRPELPCNLESALRYSANVPKAPFEALKMAYADYIKTRFKSDDSDSNQTQELMHYQVVDYRRSVLSFNFSTAICQNTKKLTNTEKGTLESKGAVTAPPKAEPTDSKAQEKFVHDHLELGVLAEYFHSFWQEHGSKYQASYDAKMKEKAQRTAVLKKSGSKGVENRIKKTFIEHTKAFVAYNKNMHTDPTHTPVRLQQSVDFFIQDYQGVTHPKTKQKISDFLNALCAQTKNQKPSPASIKRSLSELNGSVFKSFTEEAINECLSLLKTI